MEALLNLRSNAPRARNFLGTVSGIAQVRSAVSSPVASAFDRASAFQTGLRAVRRKSLLVGSVTIAEL